VVRWKDGDVIFVSGLASKALQREKDKDKDARMLMSSAPNAAPGLSPQHVAAISLQPKVPRAFLSTMPLHAGTPRWDEHTTQALVFVQAAFLRVYAHLDVAPRHIMLNEKVRQALRLKLLATLRFVLVSFRRSRPRS
jgi:hypothetical protein